MISVPSLGLFALILTITSAQSDPTVEALAQHLHLQAKVVGVLSSFKRIDLCESAASLLILLGDISYNWKKTQKQIEREVDEVRCWDYEDLFRRAGSVSLSDVRVVVNDTIRFFKYLNGIRTPPSPFCCPPCYLGHSTPGGDGKFENMSESMKLGQWILRIADKFEKISPDQLDDVVLSYLPLRVSILKTLQYPVEDYENYLSVGVPDFILNSTKTEIFNTFDGLRRRNRATVQSLLSAWVKTVELWSQLTESDVPRWTALGFLQDTEWPTNCFPAEPRAVGNAVISSADPA
ncbi:unnamed protein product [Calicophoron daubneyi]|uniref:Uncharacterized protein n=1 Tax=Calicophoron daubneyi TaxID=300641 RepID=A0AAV2TDD3_CALDB